MLCHCSRANRLGILAFEINITTEIIMIPGVRLTEHAANCGTVQELMNNLECDEETTKI